MDTATFQFYDRLNCFLPRRHRQRTITHSFDWRASIKDMIESLGVPHAEIELIVVNGQPVGFEYIVMPGDVIHVYPDRDALDLNGARPLRPLYPGRPRFVLDTHLGRLAGYLRMLGFDTLYRNDYPDDVLAQISHDQYRIVLTRDVGVLKRSLVIYGYYVRSTDPREQVREIMACYDLQPWIDPFKHCMVCNGLLTQVDKASILHELRPDTRRYYDEFHRCQNCARIYWKGSHYNRMLSFLKDVIDLE